MPQGNADDFHPKDFAVRKLAFFVPKLALFIHISIVMAINYAITPLKIHYFIAVFGDFLQNCVKIVFFKNAEKRTFFALGGGGGDPPGGSRNRVCIDLSWELFGCTPTNGGDSTKGGVRPFFALFQILCFFPLFSYLFHYFIFIVFFHFSSF